LIFVLSDVLSIKRIETPTVSPSNSPRSIATRSATVNADTRLGCVIPIKPFVCHPHSYKYLIIFVLKKKNQKINI